MSRSICTVDGCEGLVVGWGYCTKHYQRFKKHGDPHVKFEYWTREMRINLDDMLSCGYQDAQIGRVLGRSASSVRKARLRFGYKARYRQAHTAREVARIMGVHHMKPYRWIEEGRLKAVRNGARYGQFRVYQISDANLLEFVEDSEHWHCWEVEAITDRNLRTYASRVRTNDHALWLTMKEAVARTGLQYMAIWHAVDRGELPARRDGGNCILVEQQDLADWYVRKVAA